MHVKRRKLLEDKRGFGQILLFFIILFSILVIGFVGALVVVVFAIPFGEVSTAIYDIGVVGDTNISQIADDSIVPINTAVQNLGLILGIGFVMSLVSVIIFVLGYRETQSMVFVGVFFGLMLLLILGSIIISNAYEQIYSGNDEIASNLRDQALLSHLILWSPAIFTTIAFIGGIFMFVGKKEEVV